MNAAHTAGHWVQVSMSMNRLIGVIHCDGREASLRGYHDIRLWEAPGCPQVEDHYADPSARHRQYKTDHPISFSGAAR